MNECRTNLALLVRVPGGVCALAVSQVVETMRPLPVEPLADMPDFIRGVARIRGAAVPVVELNALFEAAPEATTAASGAGKRFVTLRAGGRCVALAVDGVVGLMDVQPEALGEMPPLLQSARRAVIQSIGTLDAELLFILETGRLVPETVWSGVERAHAAGR
jgi:purine-binding chemotaxis protein CheW